MSIDKKSIPVFILAGGLGTRLSEETYLKPKPMVEIGDIPLLVHIMRWYYSYGFDDFVICAGYRGFEIKNYFLTYRHHFENLDIDYRTPNATTPKSFSHAERASEKWRVRVVDTGNVTFTGGRLARAFDEISKHQKIDDFALTYGDGLCNVDLDSELEFHRSHQRIGTVMTVRPRSRFGELQIEADHAVSFLEKPADRQPAVNGGYFFFQNGFRKYLSTDEACILERQPLEKLAQDRQLMVYRHNDFWIPIDTMSDKNSVQSIWNSGNVPWVRRKEK